MIIIVEIVSRSGTRACKEYDAPTFGSAIAAAERELRGYSDFRLVDVRIKDELCRSIGGRLVGRNRQHAGKHGFFSTGRTTLR